MATRRQSKTAIRIPGWMAKEQQSFERQLPKLLEAYEGEYVAFSKGRVFDHDKNDETLALRMYRRMKGKPFYIAEVTRHPRVFEVPSIEVP